MKKTVRQTILGLGTFGTGTALLLLMVNPYLVILTDTMVGVGMLFAAGSVTVRDLGLRRGGGPQAVPAPEGKGTSPGEPGSLRGPSGAPLPAAGLKSPAKEEPKAREAEIDQMLDTALGGQSKKLISIAEGQAPAPAVPQGAAGAAKPGEDLLQGLSENGIAIPSLGDEEAGEEEIPLPPGSPEPGSSLKTVSPGSALQGQDEGSGDAQADILTLGGGEIGADDLLSALRLEAMKEKKKDDTSLLRNLKGVKVTGRELLDELDSVVREMRGR